MFAPSALAGGPGGVPAVSPSVPVATRTPAAPALRLAPVTSRFHSLLYKGPVFQKTATGEILPYVPGTPTLLSATTSPTTGGSPVGVTASGGSPVGVTAALKPELLVPGSTARYVGGIAAAPMAAPVAVQQMIWSADQIIGLPYIYGGGHASFTSPGYDCSGTVSFALHGASLLSVPQDSSELMGFGARGLGRWVTIFSNPEHAYVTVAGLRLDTSSADDPSNQQGPRWRPLRSANSGYTARHPAGL